MIPNFLYCDIETIPSAKEPKGIVLPSPPTENDVKVGNRKGEVADAYRKEQLPSLIAQWNDQCVKLKKEAEDELRKESLDPLKGKILCVGYAFDDEAPSIRYGSENEIISFLETTLANMGERCLSMQPVGFNIKNFDLEFLLHRAIKFRKPKLYRYLRNTVPVELSESVLYNKYNRRYYKFDDILRYYEIGGKPDGIDGSKVFDYWVAGRNDEIHSYCANDVLMVRELHKLLQSVL